MLSLTTLLTTHAQSNLVDTPTLLLPGTVPKTRPSRTKILPPPVPSTTPPPTGQVRPTGDESSMTIRNHYRPGAPMGTPQIPPIPPIPPPTDVEASPPLPYPTDESIIRFQKRLYSAVTTGNVTELANHFRPTFDDLNQDGILGDTLTMLYDMRLMDLQASVQHARKMRDVIDLLDV
jgi:hypothetical protein